VAPPLAAKLGPSAASRVHGVHAEGVRFAREAHARSCSVAHGTWLVDPVARWRARPVAHMLR